MSEYMREEFMVTGKRKPACFNCGTVYAVEIKSAFKAVFRCRKCHATIIIEMNEASPYFEQVISRRKEMSSSGVLMERKT